MWYHTAFPLLAVCMLFTIGHTSPIPSHNDPPLKFQKRYMDYDSSMVRGVNIGGWLVLEPYITPSLFEVFRTNEYNDDGIPVDEYHYCQQLGQSEAENRLVPHWDTFYQEEDFKNIASQGFNLVRIPVGYWAFYTKQDDPYVSGLQEAYLDKAIEWSQKHGLDVWVDLHGAAGSQNGFDNSGLRDSVEMLSNDENIQVTLNAIKYILKKYSNVPNVVGIQLLNEPLGPSLDMESLKNNFLLPAYDYVRNDLHSDQVVVIHDAFQPYHYWDNFLTLENNQWGVVVDHHHYQVFSPGELSTAMDDKISIACQWGQGVVSEGHWTVAGEFSAALTDCTKWLNGVGVGARYDGSFQKNGASSYYIGSCANNEDINTWSEERKQNTRRFIEAQLDAFEMRGGWIFWCYKTETSIEWDVMRLIYNGLFPQPLTDRKFPNQCSA